MAVTIMVTLLDEDMNLAGEVRRFWVEDGSDLYKDRYSKWDAASWVSATKALNHKAMRWQGFADVHIAHLAPNSNQVERSYVFSYSCSYTIERESVRPLD